ncbi:MAG: sigma-54 dependent transcriptional regulator [Proteobacteria bacterium]|nr:sigma-54 dependent transcriptional regulator [Pseudomonadota bacterium]MBU1137942.1 sigma-54 dependent transcriptional regulator [Pseudomonadota bacterium]
MIKILIIDDDQALARSLEIQLKAEGHQIIVAHNVSDGMTALTELIPDLVLLDLNLPDEHGLKALPAILTTLPGVTVVIMTGNTENSEAVDAMRDGAFDYLRKPLDLDELLQMAVKVESLKERDFPGKGDEKEPPSKVFPLQMIGSDQKIINVHKQIGLLARSRVTVLVTGESGTGKELVARILHEATAPSQPFVAINCSAFVPTLLESELFGYEKGAFTGADQAKEGKLEFAGKGTVFLDEIGDMSLDLQSKLLRVLQEDEFVRVGGLKTKKLEARIVAATHRNLQRMVDNGTFRQDLFYRLNVVSLTVPPLRERRGDIDHLAEHLLAKIGYKMGRQPLRLSTAGRLKLRTGNWPGNVRELENTLTRAMVLTHGTEIDADDLVMQQDDQQEQAGRPVSGTLAATERMYISQVLAEHNWNITHTALTLDVSPTTLRKKITDYHLKRAQS